MGNEAIEKGQADYLVGVLQSKVDRNKFLR
jgi:hypothetical protein